MNWPAMNWRRALATTLRECLDRNTALVHAWNAQRTPGLPRFSANELEQSLIRTPGPEALEATWRLGGPDALYAVARARLQLLLTPHVR